MNGVLRTGVTGAGALLMRGHRTLHLHRCTGETPVRVAREFYQRLRVEAGLLRERRLHFHLEVDGDVLDGQSRDVHESEERGLNVDRLLPHRTISLCNRTGHRKFNGASRLVAVRIGVHAHFVDEVRRRLGEDHLRLTRSKQRCRDDVSHRKRTELV